MAPYIVAGLVTGGVYAISALGLVLTYRSSKIFNFGHGAIGFFVAMVYYELHTTQGWAIVPAAIVAIGLVAPLLGLGLWAVLFRHLTDASPTVRLVATIGLAVALPAATQLWFGNEQIFGAPGLAPEPVRLFRVVGVNVNANQVAVIAAAVLVATAIPVLLRFTAIGLQLRASVDNRELAAAAGMNTAMISAVSWGAGSTLAGLAGVLLTPLAGLEPTYFTLLMIAGFAAAAIGGLWNMPLTFVGAMGVGLAEAFSTKYTGTSGILARGLRPSLPFFVLVAALLLQRQGGVLARIEAGGRAATGVVRRRHDLVRGWVVPTVGLAVVAAFAFVLDGAWLAALALGVAMALVFLSFVPITGDGGMISLCQASFVGVGAIAAAKLASEENVHPLLAILAGGLAAGAVGLVVALPALRLNDIYLALATFAFGLFMDNLIFPIRSLSFDASGFFGLTMPPLRVLGWHIEDDRAFVLAGLVAFAALACLVRLFRQSTLGLNMAAVRWSESAAATSGVSVIRTKLITFSLSAFIAGLGGGMLAAYNERVDIANHSVLLGILWLAVVSVFGIASIAGALVAGLVFTFMPELFAEYLPASWTQVPTILFGVGAISLAKEPDGIVSQVTRVWGPKLGGLRRRGRATSSARAVATEGIAP